MIDKQPVPQTNPYTSRMVQMGARTHADLFKAGNLLGSYQPKTKVGALALDLAVASTASYLTIMATAGYVYAVTQLHLPNPTFGEPPSGVDINPADLQGDWTSFNTSFAIIQGQLDNFMDTVQGSSNPASILSQLVSVPQSISQLSGTVTLDFATKDAANLEMLFGALQTKVDSLNTSLSTLGTNIQTSSTTLGQAAASGVLQKLYSYYEADIKELQQAIVQAQDTIDSDNAKIIGEGVGAGVSIVVGLVGLVNFWNPLGWILMAGGAVGAYFAITEIESLKAQIAGLKNTISSDTNWINTYSQAATAIQITIGAIQGFASMQAAAQTELTALENVLSTLKTDLVTAVSDLEESSPDWAAAQNEWNEIISVAGNLANITAYVWPSPQELSSPTGLASTGSGLYQVTSSGTAYYLANAAAAWSQLPDHSLSIVTGNTSSSVVGINGSPAVGAAGADPAYVTDYYVRTYDAASNVWNAISSFPAAQIATDGTTIYAINQTVSSRQVSRYNGSGTAWTDLAALPNNDASEVVAIAGSTVYALSLNTRQIYYNDGSQWIAISNTLKFIALSGNGNYLSVIDTSNNCYLWNASSNQFENSGSPTATSVLGVGQSVDGNQIILTMSQNLCSVNNASAPVITQLATNVVGFTNIGGTYRFDADGNGFYLSDLTSNAWTSIPAIA
jgi:hypothetical protein